MTRVRDGLVGRRRELVLLTGWLDDLEQGRGRLLLVVGEAGIGKTRLAQELAGLALARGTATAWGRCRLEAPALWAWRQVLQGLGHDPEALLAGQVPEERFRVVEAVSAALGTLPLVVVLDDVHDADDASMVLLQHLADSVVGRPLLLVATTRDASRAGELLRAPAAERWDLGPLGLAEVEELLGDGSRADEVLDATGGNPLFVREVARALADGTWDPQRPPRSVVDVVTGRLARLSPHARRLVQVAAVTGRDVDIDVVTDLVRGDLPVLLREAATFLDQGRFVHALVRDAVEGSLTDPERRGLHRAVAESVERRAPSDDRAADLAQHWRTAGDGERERHWATRAAEEAFRRLAYSDAVRHYRAAVAASAGAPSPLHAALGRAAYLAGDLESAVRAALGAAEAGGTPEELAEAALVLEAAPDAGVRRVATQLCERALAQRQPEASAARLLALRSHLAFYDGDQARTEELSQHALDAARRSGDAEALVEALRARQEALPGPGGRKERLELADQVLGAAAVLGSARTEMWGRLWRIEALLEGGRLARAAAELPALAGAVAHVGGPFATWHLERTSACVAQAQGRYAEAAALSGRALARMQPLEPAPAVGAWFSLQCALARHVRPEPDVVQFAASEIVPPPLFVTMARLSRAFVLLTAGRRDEADAVFVGAGPRDSWALPAFFVLPGLVLAVHVTAGLGRLDQLADVLSELDERRGEHAVGSGVSYLGPVELALGVGARALGWLEAAVQDLRAAVRLAEEAGAPGWAADARLELAAVLEQRGDRDEARVERRLALATARSLGMSALLPSEGPLSGRELEVARLVAEGLTNRQVAERLFISERTAQNHVQHVLTKLGLSNRAQIATWVMSA